jgi:hypothetical protein
MVAGTRCSGSTSIRQANPVTRQSSTYVTFVATLPNIADITLSRTTASAIVVCDSVISAIFCSIIIDRQNPPRVLSPFKEEDDHYRSLCSCSGRLWSVSYSIFHERGAKKMCSVPVSCTQIITARRYIS